MKEEITEEDITISVRGFFYKIPYNVLAADEDIREYFGEDSEDGEEIKDTLQRNDYIIDFPEENIEDYYDSDRKSSLQFIRGMIALKPKDYYSYRYVRLSDHDDDTDALNAYLSNFPDDDILSRLKRELAFYAACEYKNQKQQNHGKAK